jgi:DNA repair protein RecN (Recombination protein N)
MLNQLAVKNLAIVTQLELNFANGMHVLTGETGAGKSIIIDALSIALGERASPEQIRPGNNQAEVTASFNIKNLPTVQQLLIAQELQELIGNEECIIRRIINADGRSRAYINGHAVSAQQLKTLAPHLVHIHGQHQHHALLDSDYQRQLLDVYAEHPELLAAVNKIYQQWAAIKQAIQTLTDMQQQADKLILLNYQIQELDNLNLQNDELQTLDQQHKQLSKAEELISTCQMVTAILSGNAEIEITSTNVLAQLHSAIAQITATLKIAPQLSACAELLKQAIIQIEEASNELDGYFSKLDLDPAKLITIEQRLSAIHALARKLRIAPEIIPEHYVKLCAERDALAQANQRLEELQQQLIDCESEYKIAADKLSKSRKLAAVKLAKEITARLKTLEMPNAIFELKLEARNQDAALTPYGNEHIHFMVSTNPGQPLGLLKKIASGGELSRISLAIQVITAQKMATPTLIFDEVDVGVSGKTAATVGQLMRELGANAQIICITHLPQVAAQGHQHYKVEKLQTKEATSTQIYPLNHHQKVQELARLMGGVDITPEALAHAGKLLEDMQLN